MNNSAIKLFWQCVTVLGTPFLHVPILLAFIWYGFAFAWPTLLMLIAIEIACIGIKLVYRKERPVPQSRQGLYNRFDANSFPSVHASRVFFLATIFSLVFGGVAVAVAGFGLAAMIGYSRLYLSRHFFIDVLAGALFGTTVGLVFFYL